VDRLATASQHLSSASGRTRRMYSALSVGELVSLGSVVVIVLLAVLGPELAPFDPEKPVASERLLAPLAAHWFGTDENGIDILSRVISAPRTDVTVALVATLLSVVIGAPLGALVGFFEAGKRRSASLLGQGFLRALDVIQAFPVFVLAMVLVAVQGPSMVNIIAAIAFVNIPVFVRIVRSETLSLRERPYAEAARVVGNPDVRLVFKHLLPNALAPVLAQVSVTMGFSILLTASLSFIGAGVAPPTPEYGAMISSGAPYMILGQWWSALFPGIALGFTVFSFGVMGQTIGRLMEPGRARHAQSNRPTEAGGAVSGRALEGGSTSVVAKASVRSIESNGASVDGSRAGAMEHGGRGLDGGTESTASSVQAEPVMAVTDLTVVARSGGLTNKLLDGISFSLAPGDVLGIVGESGSGKSVLVRALLRLLPEEIEMESGEVVLLGRNLMSLSPAALRAIRGTTVAPILPNARAQLNPVIRVGTVLEAVVRAHQPMSRQAAHKKAIEALRLVGIPDPERRLAAYPHELSGGMAQRVCIAMALLHSPRLIIADEPTFGLDVTVQRQVLDTMSALVQERNASQVIVTRDLGLVAHYCQRVAVMQAGRVVEMRPVRDLFNAPREPYTKKLLAAVGASSETWSAAPVVH
jgi:peptide/nickel transport system permease protein